MGQECKENWWQGRESHTCGLPSLLESLPMPRDDERFSDRSPDDRGGDKWDRSEQWEDADDGGQRRHWRDDREPDGRFWRRKELRKIAIYQKVICVCILAYLIAVVAQFALPDVGRLLLGLGILGVALAAAVFVFLLSMELYGTGLAIVFLLLTLIPCVGLITLLVINSKATATLQRHGYRVGLLGARLSDFDE
jgi:hypothetical protein